MIAGDGDPRNLRPAFAHLSSPSGRHGIGPGGVSCTGYVFRSDRVSLPSPPASSSSRLQLLADQCVQCGLCLPACPTYALEPLETESPRGRIALIKAWESGVADPTEAGDQHLDHCLGCRRCETVCPAGVRYGEILTLARTSQRQRRLPGRRQRLFEALAARPTLLRRLLGAYRWAHPLLPKALRPLPRPPASSPRIAAPAIASQDRRQRESGNGLARVGLGSVGSGTPSVALFAGCVARGYDGPLQAALARLCAAAGSRMDVPAEQTCCGSLHAHAGDAEKANTLALQNRAAFVPETTVLNLASGCHAHILDALRGHSDVVDAIAWLERRADGLRFSARNERIALHLPCTQRSASRSDGALRALLARVPGLEVVVLDETPNPYDGTNRAGCCGAAGTQMLTDPERAARLRQPLLDQIVASGATCVLSANIGCRLHLANAAGVPVQHPLEFLGACLAE
jgi:glycolate oxidase iron-sulfur subunit